MKNQDIKYLQNDKDYIRLILEMVEDNMKDMSEISAYNDDFIAEEVSEMESILDRISEKIILLNRKIESLNI